MRVYARGSRAAATDPNAGTLIGMHLKPPRVGEILAGAFGVLLLLSLFLPWYSRTIYCAQGFVGPCPPDGVTGFDALSVLDVYLVLVALSGIGLLVVEVTQRTPAIPVAWSAIAAPLGLIGTALVLWRTLSPPSRLGDAEPLFALLGLVASAGLTAGCVLSMRNEAPGPSSAPGAGGPEPIPAPRPAPDAGGHR